MKLSPKKPPLVQKMKKKATILKNINQLQHFRSADDIAQDRGLNEEICASYL